MKPTTQRQDGDRMVTTRSTDVTGQAMQNAKIVSYMDAPEGQRLAAAAGKHDGAGVQSFHVNARHRPGVGPRPWLDLVAGCERLGEGAVQQHLRKQRLGVDVGALAEQHEAGETYEQC